MHIPKISLTFAVAILLVATSTRLSIAQDDATKISRLRADAIRTCSTAAAKFPDYSWGNMEMFIYCACMTEHRERE